jgi:uncharacterized membrane protein
MSMKKWVGRLKRTFLTGFAALFPILITFFLLSWLYTQMDKMVGRRVNAVFKAVVTERQEIFDIVFPGATEEIVRSTELRRQYVADHYPDFLGATLGLIAALFLILLFGLFLRGYVGNKVMQSVDRFFERFPIIKTIYPHARQVTNLLFGQSRREEFKHVVAIQYPRRGLYSVGFLTGTGLKNIQEQAGQNLVAVFIPNSPAPLTGFVVLVPKDDVIDLDMKVEEAIRFCITGGMVVPQNQLPRGGATTNVGTTNVAGENEVEVAITDSSSGMGDSSQ